MLPELLRVYEAAKPYGETQRKFARHLEDLVRARKHDTELMDKCILLAQAAR